MHSLRRLLYLAGMTRIHFSPDAPFNLAAYVLAAGAKTPKTCALSVLDGQSSRDLTYAELISAVRGTASGLLSLGLRPGARVLLRLGNTPDFPIAYLGIIAAGMIAVPTSAQLTSSEITKLAADLTPDLVISAPDVARPEGVTSVDLSTLQSWRSLLPAPYHMGDPERPAYIVYTSGTSGTARGVVHAHRAITARRMMHEGWYGLRATDRLLHAGAFNWTFTLGTGLMDPWTLGAAALIPAPQTEPRALPRLLADHNATLFAAAPGLIRKACQGDVPPLPKLRHALSAGEKLPASIRDAWRSATGTEIYEAFGMSECSTFISASPAAQAAPNTLGRPQPGRRVALIGSDGQPLPQGRTGVIAVHRSDPGLMLGYLGAPEETKARFAGEWFMTGDLGTQTSGGDITYEGRDDDMMNAGGVRVSPIEVEDAFHGLDGLTASAAVQVRVKEGVSVIALFYSADAELDQDALEALATERLASYKRPRIYQRCDALPTSGNGKLLRRTLRETYEASHDQT